ncbi:MAG: hypothetical protein RSB64_10890, partial [Pseudomonas sp.]
NMMASHGWISGGHGFQISHRNTLPHSTFSQSTNRPGIFMAPAVEMADFIDAENLSQVMFTISKWPGVWFCW